MINLVKTVEAKKADTLSDRPCMDRRKFLQVGGVAVATTVFTMPGFSGKLMAETFSMERKKIAKLSDLKNDVPVYFSYGSESAGHSQSMLVKLGTEAGGGVGKDKDVVAFNMACTHMGGPLAGTYNGKYKAVGPCPFHLTTFDLVKHGMVMAGQATANLPRILLETSGDAIYATGVMGLIYGLNENFS